MQLEILAFQATKISKIGKLRKIITIKLGKVVVSMKEGVVNLRPI
jgi:hypothetical protein